MKQTFLLLLTMNLFSLFARAEPLAIASPAPQITAKNQDAQDVIFGDVYSKGITLVYFYPKAETPGCTKEACAFRDEFAQFKKKGAVVFGVSPDSVKSHDKFVEKF